MATFRKRGARWQAEVRRQGVYETGTFSTKAAAQAWAAKIEGDLETIRLGKIPERLFGDALDKYAKEVSPSKRGAHWEIVRLSMIDRHEVGKRPLKDWQISSLGPQQWSEWRDARLQQVSPGTVLREANLISHVYTLCLREWKWARENPFHVVRMPPEPPARDRLPTQDEMDRLAIAFGDDLNTATGRTWAAFRFSCETAMRAGEIIGLRPGDIVGRVARLCMTKNGASREVPLSPGAIAILDSLPKLDPIFGLTAPIRDALWRKGMKRAGVVGLRFHDARAYGVTQLSKRVDVLSLARISGHKDLKMLMRYYRETAEDLAGKL